MRRVGFGFEVDVTGIQDYQRKLLVAKDKLRDFERRFLETLANIVLQEVIPNTPVDTGRLRRSWKVTKVEEKGGTLEITVYNDARDNGSEESYASYVEFGHFTRNRISWVEGRRMLTIATDEVEAEMERVWNILFDKYVKEMGL